MNIKGKISETGGRLMPDGRYINEDILTCFSVEKDGKNYDFVVLMDGATGLGKDCEIQEGYTAAEWYVKFFSEVLKENLTQNPICSLEDAVEYAILKSIDEIKKHEEKNNIVLEEYQKPSATLSLLRADETTTEIYLNGDVQAIVAYQNGKIESLDNPNQKALQKLDNKTISRMVELAKATNCNVVDTRATEEIQNMLKSNRSKKNSGLPDGYWACGTTEGAAKHGVSIRLNNGEIEGIILASDGLDFAMLKLNEEELYKLIVKKGINEVAKLIREKQDEDPYCNKFPRFKKSDDLTAVYLEY